jgi:hypothetical protein
MRWVKHLPLCLQCAFSASFAPVSASDARTAFKPYRYEFQLDRVSVRILKTQLWVPIIRHHMEEKHHFFLFSIAKRMNTTLFSSQTPFWVSNIARCC